MHLRFLLVPELWGLLWEAELLDLTFLVFGSDSEGWVLERPHYGVLCVSDAYAYTECRYAHSFVKLGP